MVATVDPHSGDPDRRSVDLIEFCQPGCGLASGRYGLPLWGVNATFTRGPVAEVRTKFWGYAAIALGVLALLIAVLADPLGIGGNDGFGWKQGFVASSGLSIALGGVGLMRGWFTGLRRRPADETTRAGHRR